MFQLDLSFALGDVLWSLCDSPRAIKRILCVYFGWRNGKKLSAYIESQQISGTSLKVTWAPRVNFYVWHQPQMHPISNLNLWEFLKKHKTLCLPHDKKFLLRSPRRPHMWCEVDWENVDQRSRRWHQENRFRNICDLNWAEMSIERRWKLFRRILIKLDRREWPRQPPMITVNRKQSKVIKMNVKHDTHFNDHSQDSFTTIFVFIHIWIALERSDERSS